MAPNAYAYLDPGTGSFMLQMLVAGALGAIFYLKIAWVQTKSFFVRLFSGASKDHAAIEPDRADTKK